MPETFSLFGLTSVIFGILSIKFVPIRLAKIAGTNWYDFYCDIENS